MERLIAKWACLGVLAATLLWAAAGPARANETDERIYKDTMCSRAIGFRAPGPPRACGLRTTTLARRGPFARCWAVTYACLPARRGQRAPATPRGPRPSSRDHARNAPPLPPRRCSGHR